MKTDRLSEAWIAKHQLGQRAVVAAGLMAQERDPRWRIWLRVEGQGEAIVEVAWDLGCRDGGSVLQILKQIEARFRKDKEWKRKHKKYSQWL